MPQVRLKQWLLVMEVWVWEELKVEIQGGPECQIRCFDKKDRLNKRVM